MFTVNLAEVKYQQEELHRHAANYRLTKSLETRSRFSNRLNQVVGSLMVNLGKQLVTLSQTALSH